MHLIRQLIAVDIDLVVPMPVIDRDERRVAYARYIRNACAERKRPLRTSASETLDSIDTIVAYFRSCVNFVCAWVGGREEGKIFPLNFWAVGL